MTSPDERAQKFDETCPKCGKVFGLYYFYTHLTHCEEAKPMNADDKAREIVCNGKEPQTSYEIGEVKSLASHLRAYGAELEADRDRWADSAVRLEKALAKASAEGFRRGVESVKCNCACEGCMEHDANWKPTQAGGGVCLTCTEETKQQDFCSMECYLKAPLSVKEQIFKRDRS